MCKFQKKTFILKQGSQGRLMANYHEDKRIIKFAPILE